LSLRPSCMVLGCERHRSKQRRQHSLSTSAASSDWKGFCCAPQPPALRQAWGGNFKAASDRLQKVGLLEGSMKHKEACQNDSQAVYRFDRNIDLFIRARHAARVP
jgi:hypothetical protein